jgi:hypothetical protein
VGKQKDVCPPFNFPRSQIEFGNAFPDAPRRIGELDKRNPPFLTVEIMQPIFADDVASFADFKQNADSILEQAQTRGYSHS